MRNLLTFIALHILVLGYSQENPLVMFPSLSPEGNQISFSFQGDIWTMSLDNNVTRRLTIHEGYDIRPQWSPDGSRIVFQSSRFDNNDIFVMDAHHGSPRRLTFHSSDDEHPQWINNEEILFASRRGFAQVEREDEIHTVSAHGGTPQRLIDAVGLSPVAGNNNLICFVRGTCRTAREAYTGPANREIWMTNMSGDFYHQVIQDASQDILPDMAQEYLYFLSARTGNYNIHRVEINASGEAIGSVEQLTNYNDHGITYYDVSHNGSQIVFSHYGSTYVMNAEPNAEINKLNFSLPDDQRFDEVEHKKYTSNINQYALSPDKEQIILNIHGELILKFNDKEKNRTHQLTNHPYRDKNSIWVNDSTILFSSDRNGNFDIYKLTSKDPKDALYGSFSFNVKQLTNNTAEDEGLRISPDKEKMVFRRGRGQLILVDIDSSGDLSNERILLDGWDSPQGISWSPDSKWIAYGLNDLDFNREIYVHAIDQSQKPVNISLHPRGDFSPIWSPDGSKLGFLSERNNDDADVWFVWLQQSDWEKTQRDWEDEDYFKNKEEEEDSVVTVIIDFQNMHERLQQVTRLAGNERTLAFSKDGEKVFFSSNGGSWQGSGGESSLYSIKWDGSELETILKEISINQLKLEPDGEKLYALKSGGSLITIDADAKKSESQSFQAYMDIDHSQEREQVFEEAWRRLRDGFYDPEFHGNDWESIKSQYKPLCQNASTSQDFKIVFNQMLGQLNASHMGLFGSDPEELQTEETGLLGIDIKPTNAGAEVIGIITGSPADRSESKLEIGDIITAVNNQPIAENINFYSLLIGKENERTLLTVLRTNGSTEDVIIRPTNSIRNINYKAWVQKRKDLTNQYSNGRLGYIHIQGMNWQSFERFERELTASGLGKEGIVIDVRYNGGGWTTDMLMTVLNVRQHSFTIPRGAAVSIENEKNDFRNNYPFGERLPLSSWTKPRIALCNENSYSNAEIFSHAFQSLGHGTLVGKPTFGAVISTGGWGLLDGSFVRMPFRAWYVKSTNKNMEHGPAVPDIIVSNLPDSKAKDEDPQLQRAVSELLNQIDQ